MKMQNQIRNQPRATVVTVSDRCFRHERVDVSGPRIAALLAAAGYSVEAAMVPDEQEQIVEAIQSAAKMSRLVITTGGTGIAPRDVTPEATRTVCDRILEGFGERMRSEGLKQTPLAPLSRAVAGTAGTTLIINLPGSPDGAISSLAAVIELVPHALALLAGHTEHADPRDEVRAH